MSTDQTQPSQTYRVFLERGAGNDIPEMAELGPFETADAAEQAALAWLRTATPAPRVDAAGNLVAWVAEVQRGRDIDELGFPLTVDEAKHHSDAEWERDWSFVGAFLLQPQPQALTDELNRRMDQLQREDSESPSERPRPDRASSMAETPHSPIASSSSAPSVTAQVT